MQQGFCFHFFPVKRVWKVEKILSTVILFLNASRFREEARPAWHSARQKTKIKKHLLVLKEDESREKRQLLSWTKTCLTGSTLRGHFSHSTFKEERENGELAEIIYQNLLEVLTHLLTVYMFLTLYNKDTRLSATSAAAFPNLLFAPSMFNYEVFIINFKICIIFT